MGEGGREGGWEGERGGTGRLGERESERAERRELEGPGQRLLGARTGFITLPQRAALEAFCSSHIEAFYSFPSSVSFIHARLPCPWLRAGHARRRAKPKRSEATVAAGSGSARGNLSARALAPPANISRKPPVLASDSDSAGLHSPQLRPSRVRYGRAPSSESSESAVVMARRVAPSAVTGQWRRRRQARRAAGPAVGAGLLLAP